MDNFTVHRINNVNMDRIYFAGVNAYPLLSFASVPTLGKSQ